MTVPRAPRRLQDLPILGATRLMFIRPIPERRHPTPYLSFPTFIPPAGRFARVIMA